MNSATRSLIAAAYIPTISRRVSILAGAASGLVPTLSDAQVADLIGQIQVDIAAMSQSVEVETLAQALGIPAEAASAQLNKETEELYQAAADSAGIPLQVFRLYVALGLAEPPGQPTEGQTLDEFSDRQKEQTLTPEEQALFDAVMAAAEARAAAKELQPVS